MCSLVGANPSFPRKRVIYSCEQRPLRDKSVDPLLLFLFAAWLPDEIPITSRKDRSSGWSWCRWRKQISRMWRSCVAHRQRGAFCSLMDVRLIYRRACQCQGPTGIELKAGRAPTPGWNSRKKFWEWEKNLRDRRDVNASWNCTFVCVTLVCLSVGTNREKVPRQPHPLWL